MCCLRRHNLSQCSLVRYLVCGDFTGELTAPEQMGFTCCRLSLASFQNTAKLP
jgi:hypothetical protein